MPYVVKFSLVLTFCSTFIRWKSFALGSDASLIERSPLEAPKKNPWAHGEDMLPPNFPSPTWCPLGKLTWNLKRMVSKRNLLFQGSIFRFHVKFRGSIPKNMFFSLVFRAMDNIHLAQRMYRLTIFTVYTYHNSLLPEATLHVILLMEETLHQLRLVVYPISEPSTVRHVIKLYPKAPCDWNIYLHLP